MVLAESLNITDLRTSAGIIITSSDQYHSIWEGLRYEVIAQEHLMSDRVCCLWPSMCKCHPNTMRPDGYVTHINNIYKWSSEIGYKIYNYYHFVICFTAVNQSMPITLIWFSCSNVNVYDLIHH